MRMIWIIAVGCAAWTVSSSATAHSLNLFVHGNADGTVTGNAYFTGGDPAQNLAVRIEDPKGKLLGETTTDAAGNFKYSGDPSVGVMKFVVTTEDGHRAAANVEFSAAAAPTPVTPAASASNDDIAGLYKAIDTLEHRLWMRDVIGGIGYIFGLAGLWALWKARSGRSGH